MTGAFLVRTGLILATLLLGLGAFSALATRRIAAAFPPTGRFVTIDGGRLHVTERLPAGPARGTVVLLHGATGNQADLMVPLGDRLAALGFRVLAPDRPGHGWSDRPDGAEDAAPARQAVLIRQGLEQLGVSHAIVLGHSWSGALAVAFALDQRDFTDGLVLVSPVTHPWPGGIAWYYGLAASPWTGPVFNRLVAAPLGLLALDAGVASVFAPQAPPDDFVRRTGVELVLRPAAFTANAQDVAGLLDAVRAQSPRMDTITVPTAIVTGDSDGIVSPAIHSAASHRAIAGSTLEVLPGVGHSPHWIAPERVVAAVVSVADRLHLQLQPAEAPHT